MRLDTGLAVRITIAHVISFRTDPSFAISTPFLMDATAMVTWLPIPHLRQKLSLQVVPCIEILVKEEVWILWTITWITITSKSTYILARSVYKE
jgi:hypothetical protein